MRRPQNVSRGDRPRSEGYALRGRLIAPLLWQVADECDQYPMAKCRQAVSGGLQVADDGASCRRAYRLCRYIYHTIQLLWKHNLVTFFSDGHLSPQLSQPVQDQRLKNHGFES